ncbi:MAG TPA: hypothetical protein VJ731_00165 [Terriglobales bacterium]|nr:hypothetical protein [Terriglobales bacterium]
MLGLSVYGLMDPFKVPYTLHPSMRIEVVSIWIPADVMRVNGHVDVLHPEPISLAYGDDLESIKPS